MNELAKMLRALIRRVERNVPNHRNPEQFHAEKSDIVDGLNDVATKMEGRRAG